VLTLMRGPENRSQTVLFYAQWMAGHERSHVRQVGRIVNEMR
jgi:hypothetical protein